MTNVSDSTNEKIPDGLELTSFDPSFYADPYAVYAKLRRLDPVHRDQTSFYETSWTITEFETTRSLLRHPALSVEAAKVGLRRDPRADNPVTLRDRDLMNVDDPDHRRLRSLVEQAFTKKRIDEFKNNLQDVATQLIDEVMDKISESGELDLVPHIAKPFPTIAIAQFLGVDVERHEDFKRWTDIALMQGYPQPSEQQWQQIIEADQQLRDYIRSVIAQRREQPKEDLISALIEAKDQDDILSEEEIIDMCWLLIGAGNFTTTDLISNCVLALLQNPAAMQLVVDDAQQWVPAAVAETVRYDCPALNMRRFVTEDIEVGATTIAKGSVVNLILAAANHDPKVFERPDEFDIQRKSQVNLGFGFGMHHCLGFLLAKTETQVIISQLLEKWPQMKLSSHRRNKNFNFRGCSELIIRIA